MNKLVLLLIMLSISTYAATFTDEFDRASLGDSWPVITEMNTMAIINDSVVGTVNSTKNGNYYNAIDTADSQSATISVDFTTTCVFTYIALRVKGNAQTFYYMGYGSTTTGCRFGRYVNGTNTTLGTTAWSASTGDNITFTVHHDSLIGLRNGVPIDTFIDGNITGGGYGGITSTFLTSGSYGYITQYSYTDNNNTTVECDTADAVVYDSTVSALYYKLFARCGETDSLGFAYALDTLNPDDTIWHTDGYAEGDLAVDSIVELSPSTRYWYVAIDSLKQSTWKFAYTMNDTDGVVIDSTIVILVQPKNLSFLAGVFTDTFVYMTSNAEHFAWNQNGEWSATDNDTLTFEAFAGMDGWLVFGYAYTGTDTVWTDTITLTEDLPDSIYLDSISILSLHVEGTFSDTIDSVSNASISNVTDTSLDVTFTTPLKWDNANDTIQFWINTQNFIRNYYLTLPPIIDSTRPNPWYRNKRFSTYGKDLDFIDTVFLGNFSLHNLESKLSSQIIDTTSSTIPRGPQPLRLIYTIDDILNVRDTIIDTLDIFVPKWGR